MRPSEGAFRVFMETKKDVCVTSRLDLVSLDTTI